MGSLFYTNREFGSSPNRRLIISTAKSYSKNITIYCSNNPQICILCGFDRASSLICGNKMPTRCNRGLYCRSYCLPNMFRAPLCQSSGAQECYTMVAACGISCCGFQAPHQTNNLKTTARNTTGSNHCITLLSSWWWAQWCPKHVEQAIRSAIKTSVASSWHFISTYYTPNIYCFRNPVIVVFSLTSKLNCAILRDVQENGRRRRWKVTRHIGIRKERVSLPSSSETIREQKFQNSSTVHEHRKAAVIGEGVNFWMRRKRSSK